jgi:hypothetical protein
VSSQLYSCRFLNASTTLTTRNKNSSINVFHCIPCDRLQSGCARGAAAGSPPSLGLSRKQLLERIDLSRRLTDYLINLAGLHDDDCRVVSNDN